MKRYLILLLLLFIAACEPLSPEVTPQQVIIITNTPMSGSIATLTAVPTFVIPTRIPPTPTATLSIIPTGTVPPCEESEGRLLESAFSSNIVGGIVDYNLYLPPCFFESGRRYPYLILLHGSGYNSQQWDDLGIKELMDAGIADKSLPPMVIAMPDGGALQDANLFDAEASFEDVILDEFIPDLEQSFCLVTSRNGRAIGGISRGGFWAFSIAFRNPDRFSAVGGHSPFFAPDIAPNSHNPLALAEVAPAIETLRIYVDNSQNDITAPNIIAFTNALTNRGTPFNYTVNTQGEHDNNYWSEHLNEYLTFYGENWTREVAGLTSCQQ